MEVTAKRLSNYLIDMFTKVGFSIIFTFGFSFSLVKLTPKLVVKVFFNPVIMLIMFIGEIVLLFTMYHKVNKKSLENINLLFSLFVILNSCGLTIIYFLFSLKEIIYSGISAGFFFISMGLYGYFTKEDISHWGSIIRSVMLSLLFVSLFHGLLNIITGYRSSVIELLASMVMIVLVSLHTAYEMNQYKLFFFSNRNSLDKKALVTLGAVSLYLNYIILFKNILKIIRMLNKRK